MIDIKIGPITGVEVIVKGLDNVSKYTPQILQGQANIIGKMIVEKARSYLGTPGPAGNKWRPIKPDTLKKRKVNRNKNPLLDTGEMRSSIKITERGKMGVVVSATHWRAHIHEYGRTMRNIPRRPFMEPARDYVENNKTFNKQLDIFIRQKVKGLFEGQGFVDPFFSTKYSLPKMATIQRGYSPRRK